ncbi:hypothetical protein [Agromyces larvae]|uniref:DUF2384 domain-containing protein n=1 Tax=Agromyces larvae TaxID=2929802 RepID=A0ABY4C0L4_9MICO|nr:hypothetical protein [Agromyces larvae]UOE44970.1 hypothetical protein MTO99_04095 [Agromyces larvae]
MPITQEPERGAEPHLSVRRHGSDEEFDLQILPLEAFHVIIVRRASEEPVDLDAAISASLKPGPVEVDLPPTASNLMVEFLARLQSAIAERGAHSLDDIDIPELADRLAAVLPTTTGSDWDRLVGPFYDTRALARWKNLSKQRLSVLRRERRLLGLTTADGELVHPSFQFDDGGGLLPHLPDLQDILERGIEDEWTRALWLNTPLELWGGLTAAQMLRGSRDDVAAVLRMAEQDIRARYA